MHRLIFFIIFTIIVSVILSSCQSAAAASSTSNLEVAATSTAALRCAQPAPEHVAICQQWEQEILATTVRIPPTFRIRRKLHSHLT